MSAETRVLMADWRVLAARLRGQIELIRESGHADSLYMAFLDASYRTVDDEARTLIEAIEDGQ